MLKLILADEGNYERVFLTLCGFNLPYLWFLINYFICPCGFLNDFSCM